MIRRPSYATVTSTLALFVALGGTGYAAVGTSTKASTTARRAVLPATPLAYARIVADHTNGGMTVDSSLSYGVTGVYDTGVVHSGKEIVCVYGSFSPHAVAATAELSTGIVGSQLTEVDIAQGWLIQRCPQGEPGTSGHVVAAVTLPIMLAHGSTSAANTNVICSTTANRGAVRRVGVVRPAGQPSEPIGPGLGVCGVYLLFF